MYRVGKITRVSVASRVALNETMRWTRRTPEGATKPPGVYLRAIRSYMRMPQAELARLSGVPQPQIVGIEKGRNVELATLQRLFGALQCDLLLIPRARMPLGDVMAERKLVLPLYFMTDSPVPKSRWREETIKFAAEWPQETIRTGGGSVSRAGRRSAKRRS